MSGDEERVPSPSLLNRSVLGLCAIGALIVAWLFQELRHDDAYITFRYAQNLATGQGFAFNPGEPILGTTTPLFTMLLAMIYVVFGDVLAEVTIFINAAALGVQAFVLHRLLRDTAPYTALLVAMAVLAGLASSDDWLALETNMTAALALAALLAFELERVTVAGVLLGMAFLTRYDMVLLTPLLVVLSVIRGRGLPIRTLVVASAVVLPWLVFSVAYFGSPLPQSLWAKQGLSDFSSYLSAYADYFTRVQPLQAAPLPIRLLLLAAFFASGLAFAARGTLAWLMFVSLGLALLLSYALIGAPNVHHWHMYGATLAVRTTALIGVFGWLEWGVQRLRDGRGPRWVFAVLALCYLGWLGTILVERSEQVKTAYWTGERHRRYTLVAEWMTENVPPGQRFMSTEVGTLGYLTGHHMIDPFGLINWTNDWPHNLRVDSYLDLVEHYQPDVILLDSPAVARALRIHVPSLRYDTVRIFGWRSPGSTLVVRRHP